MCAYLREDFHTDRSIQLDSEPDSPQRPLNNSIYLDKMEAHLAFMEKEFRRNIEWQRNLLNQIKRGRKEQVGPQRKNGSAVALLLKPKDEGKLKEVLRDYCSVTNGRLELSQLIRLAISLKEKGPLERDKDKENEIVFPHFPKVITLNDLAPSTHNQLQSSRVSPIRIMESRVKVPKYRKTVKTPHQLFSPEPEELPKMMNCVMDEAINVSKQPKKEKLMEGSLEKRLKTQDDNNFVTFREYLGDTFRNKLSENISLNFSTSRRQEPFCPQVNNESLLLLSEEQEPHQNPSIYLQLLSKQAKEEQRCKKEQEILCFSATKKRKIPRKERAPKHPLSKQDDSKLKIKKLHDSFGKIYEEFQQVKPHHQNDRDTLESD